MTHRQKNRLCSIAAVCLTFAATMADAQRPVPAGQRQLVGTVRDGAGAALEGVIVVIPGMTARSDSRGGFELFTVPIDTVTISFKRVGFEPIEALLTARNKLWDTVLVQMEFTAQRLNSVDVSSTTMRASLGLRSFDERRLRGIGQFVTHAEIIERGSSRLSDILRTKRGVYVVRGDRVRFSAYGAARGSMCQPDIWVDGRRTQGAEINEFTPNTVEAIELYPYLSTVPVEFQSMGANTTPCGTIVVWTRVPNGRKR